MATVSIGSINKIYKDIGQKIPYDNYNENNNIILNLDVCDDVKGIYHKLNVVIALLEEHYSKKKINISWVTNSKLSTQEICKKILLIADKLDFEMSTPNPNLYLNALYFNLLSIDKKFDIIEKALDFIFSPKCKNQKLLNHPTYKKGRQYCSAALVISENMISQLTRKLIETETIKDRIIKAFQETEHVTIMELVKKAYPSFETVELAEKQKMQKDLNKNIYCIILNILSPCNFYYLFYNFYHFTHTHNIWLHMYKESNSD
jgi:hypothetical protein